MDADYSQIELRLLAHIADDKAMQDGFRTGADIHAITASQVMGVPLTEGDVQHIFSIMQMNAEEAAKAVKDVTNENVLIVLHAADSRNTVKKAAKSQAEALEPAER